MKDYSVAKTSVSLGGGDYRAPRVPLAIERSTEEIVSIATLAHTTSTGAGVATFSEWAAVKSAEAYRVRSW